MSGNPSIEQRTDALAKAQAVRRKRARMKEGLKKKEISPKLILMRPPEYIMSMRTFDFLLAVPSFGRDKTRKVLTHCGIAQATMIKDLTKRQHEMLLATLC